MNKILIFIMGALCLIAGQIIVLAAENDSPKSFGSFLCAIGGMVIYIGIEN